MAGLDPLAPALNDTVIGVSDKHHRGNERNYIKVHMVTSINCDLFIETFEPPIPLID